MRSCDSRPRTGDEMTRKVGQRSEETREALLNAARAEFASKGFQKASLRKICADAGVTTGALYFFFENKEDVLREVIAPVERMFTELVELFSEENIHNDGLIDSERVHECLSNLYDNREAVTIVLNNRDAPVVVDFYGGAVRRAEKRVEKAFAEAGEERKPDPFLAHWYAHLQVEMILHTIEHSESVEEAEDHLKTMVRFVRGGLAELSK